MKIFKKIAVFICLAAITALSAIPSYALDIDIGEWNRNENLYPVLTEQSNSNSAVTTADLKVEYDNPSNRVRLLFMLELNSFTDVDKAGITLSVNDGEKITLHLDGTSEYNKDKYFAEIKSVTDKWSKNIYMEVTLGIKDGIPEKTVLSFNFYDTEGIASNTYTLDITERHEPTEATTETTTKTTKKKSEKTTKTKATKTTAEKETASKSTTINKTTVISEKTDNKEASFKESSVVGIVTAVAIAAIGIGTGAVNIIRRSKKTRDGG